MKVNNIYRSNFCLNNKHKKDFTKTKNEMIFKGIPPNIFSPETFSGDVIAIFVACMAESGLIIALQKNNHIRKVKDYAKDLLEIKYKSEYETVLADGKEVYKFIVGLIKGSKAEQTSKTNEKLLIDAQKQMEQIYNKILKKPLEKPQVESISLTSDQAKILKSNILGFKSSVDNLFIKTLEDAEKTDINQYIRRPIDKKLEKAVLSISKIN